jgi:hypothetical protein
MNRIGNILHALLTEILELRGHVMGGLLVDDA